MKAIVMHEFGGPEVLKEEQVERPVPADDEVLVKIFASGVNPVDWKIREGQRKEKFPVKFPLIPGWDVSGIIEETGTSVKNFTKGDEVYSRPDPTRNGTYAEYVVIKAGEVGMKPKSIGHTQAAAVPLAGLTAWQGLFDQGNLQAGQRVLIHAASGGVGTFAVQFAKWKGAYVIGTTSEKNVSFVRSLGADEVIDYKKEKFEELLSEVDLVLDTIGGDTQRRSLPIIKSGGCLVTTLKPEFQAEAGHRSIEVKGYTAMSYPDQLKQIADLIDAGLVKPVISDILPLESAAQAQELSKQGHLRGKVVLQVRVE